LKINPIKNQHPKSRTYNLKYKKTERQKPILQHADSKDFHNHRNWYVDLINSNKIEINKINSKIID